MEYYRCCRCQAVLTTVAAPPGESFALLLDPLVERRLLDAAERHLSSCEAVDPPPPRTTRSS